MARSRTLANLRSDVRQRADMVNSGFCSDSEINEYINQSIAELYDLLLTSYGDDYYTTSATLSWLANTDTLPTPSDFYKLSTLEYSDSDRRYPLDRLAFADLRKRRRSAGWSTSSLPRYSLVGGVFVVDRVPTSNQTLTCWYVPAPLRLANDSDTFDGISGWEEYVVCDAAAKCLEKEESDASALLSRKLMLKQRIEQASPTRDTGNPPTVRDVYRSTLDWWDCDD